ncbi:hypothetical protein HMPREF0326_03026 [Desulfovibrio sp. 3_1_syn3]|uniref:hypothetical protein n=1 Tax=Desulfovibrio sp. 3_1_syn3 TaxID=457398 RepID=UPI0001E12D54|nr:hypothetical protein [Desulfovibrio sp. 3_1_syn3]EFL84333.1 hypothetical protein HMPREF0326_03026 [Desulfovibrio sp. 3_1_syn3]
MRRILSLCDYSGVWSQPYADAGYEVIRIDIQTDGSDVRLLERMNNVHGILAAPPCTCFASSGARWTRTDADMVEALSVVDACIRLTWVHRATLRWWALENPVGKLARYLGRPKMYFNPCDYGDPYTKRTCLWGTFTPPMPLLLGEDRRVKPIRVNSQGSWMQSLSGRGKNTKNLRSKTPPQFARAFFEVNP